MLSIGQKEKNEVMCFVTRHRCIFLQEIFGRLATITLGLTWYFASSDDTVTGITFPFNSAYKATPCLKGK